MSLSDSPLPGRPSADALKVAASAGGDALDIAVKSLATMGASGTSKRLSKVVLYAALFKASQQSFREIQATWQAERQWSVKVNDDDTLFELCIDWLISEAPPIDSKQLHAYTRRSEGGSPTMRVGHDRDANIDFDLTMEGYKVKVYVSKAEPPMSGGGSGVQPIGMGYSVGRPKTTINFNVKSREAREVVIRQLGKLVKTGGYEPGLFMPSSWGEWRRRDDTPKRAMESVILSDGKAADLIADLQHFYDMEEKYARIHAPWHRGYLFHGPPGTGKTSLAKGLATYFNLDLYYLPLSGVKTDEDLMSLVSSLKPRTILLIEDIDVAHAAKNRDDDAEGVSMSGLLNALDGVATPNGLVTIMTTNNLSVLDDALLRPGRADRLEEIGYPDTEQISRILAAFVEDPADRPVIVGREGLTPADIIEVIKRHLHDSTGLRDALSALNQT
jgi:chaperone BCS1